MDRTDTGGVTGRPAASLVAWPGWAHLRYALWLSLANTAWFCLVYGGANYLTSRRTLRIPVHLPWELRIPLVPAMTLVYMSIYLLFFLGPFVLRQRREFAAAVWTLACVTTIGGLGFLLVPAQVAFPAPREEQLGVWARLFHLADDLSLPYNLVPSLHVALSVACIAIYASRAAPVWRTLLWVWAALVALSTLLTHQHHLVDVVAGWLLGIAGVHWVYWRLAAADRLGAAPRAG